MRSRARRSDSAYYDVLYAVGTEPVGVVSIAREIGVSEVTVRKHLESAVAHGEVVRSGHPNVRFLYAKPSGEVEGKGTQPAHLRRA